MRAYCAGQIDLLWDEVKRFENPHNYYVDLSQKLWDIKQSLLEQKADRSAHCKTINTGRTACGPVFCLLSHSAKISLATSRSIFLCRPSI